MPSDDRSDTGDNTARARKTTGTPDRQDDNQPAASGALLPGPETVPDAWSRSLNDAVLLAVGYARERLKAPLDPGTIAQYRQIVQRLHRRQTGLSSAVSPIDHDRTRAALTAFAASSVLEAVTPDHAGLKEDTDEQEFRQCLAVLLAYPPRDHFGYQMGESVQPRPRGRRKDDGTPATGARARRDHVARLARSPRMRRGDFWRNGPEEPDLASALAVAIATGLRPVELADGVRLRVAGVNLLEIAIPGAKSRDDAGYAWRALTFPVGAPETVHLDDRARACGGRAYVACRNTTLRAVVKATAHRTFDRRLADEVTPYTLRHLAAGRFRQTLDGATAARALGHRSPSTTREYSRARAPGPVPERVDVPGSGTATLATDPPPG